jgi:hypothetical protein
MAAERSAFVANVDVMNVAVLIRPHLTFATFAT